MLVATQPDLGTSILIALGGVTVSWLAGVRVKFFAYASILFISLTPIGWIICLGIIFFLPKLKRRNLSHNIEKICAKCGKIEKGSTPTCKKCKNPIS